MSPNELNELLRQTVGRLSEPDEMYGLFYEMEEGDPLPSGPELAEIIELCRAILFPGFYGKSTLNNKTLPYHIGVSIDRLCHLLTQQVLAGLCFQRNEGQGARSKEQEARGKEQEAKSIVAEFIKRLPELRRILATDVEAAYNGDPAAESYGEIISCYPVIKAVTNYRIAHELLLLGVPLIPRIITEMAHSETGIDIHPGAQIGHHFTIDHGTGVVIGATCIIGNNVKLYQGVTLGAKSFPLDEKGNPMKGIARHPILEDNVIVYSNATILGRITIAKGTVIGGNVWVTESTKPGEQLVQAKKRISQVVRPEDWGCL
ncbi:MAG: serine acetyltransferase [Bacteroidaceae bacterium]|nr:serine acetyltransferase [Bacteroidaceae bacterium]